MGSSLIDGVVITPLKDIATNNGSVLHAMRKSDDGFHGFGEAYFSIVNYRAIRGWKRHQNMTLNLIVPVGEIKFVLIDDRQPQRDIEQYEVALSRKNYSRLTIPPGIWVGFQGLSKNESMLLNLANLLHDPKESDHKEINQFSYRWDI